MKIRRLEIQGFKSFADRTVLTFGEGITGVVGPNGCGKSNIVDAIRWTMGEQSAKHLRGNGMQDVIFAGSESRGPVGVAEVTITFKNDGALVPPEYQKYEEISVTRRLFRDGTSEYAINKLNCRLRDVLDLFMGTGIGKQAYSIIEQGRIGLIVTAKAEDRRAFIEEAAGISRYKARRKQAERRIEATQQNLLRVSDITAELKQRIGSLERQAKKAEKYKRIKDELRGLELHGAAHRDFELRALERYELDQAGAIRDRIGAGEASLESEETRIEEALDKLQAKDQLLRGREAQIHQHQQAEALAKNNAEFLAREREGHRQRAEEARRELDVLSTELVTLTADREAAFVLRRDLDASGGEERGSLADRERALAGISAEIDGADEELEADKQALVATLTMIAKHNNNLLNLDRASSDLDARIARADVASKAAAERLKEMEKEAKETRHTLHENRQLKLALEDRKAAQESLLERLRGELMENEAVLLAGREELADKRSRLNSLLEIQRNYEGCRDGVRSIMKQKDTDPRFHSALHGLVADVVSAEARYETAVEAVLGDRLQYVIVNSQSDGMASIDFLKQSEDGRSSFIPLDLREDHVSWAPRVPSDWPHRSSAPPQSELPFQGARSEAGHEAGYEAVEATVSGATGVSGAAGASDAAGATGPAGASGVSGVSAASGASAAPGAAGVSGASGATGAAQPAASDAPSALAMNESFAPIPSAVPSETATPSPSAYALPVPARADDVVLFSESELWPDLTAPGVCGKLVDLVSTQPGYEQVARVLLGDVVVVEEMRTAQKLWRENGHRKTLVTLSGEVLDPVGVLTGGAFEGVSAGMLSQKREIKELSDHLRMLEAHVRIAEERHATLKQRISELDRAIKELSKEGHQEELSLVKLERDLKRLEENIQRHIEEKRAHDEEIDRIGEKRAEVSGEADGSRAILRDLEAKRSHTEAELSAKTEETALLREKARALAKDVTELKVTVAANTERREGSERNLSRIVARIADVDARIARLNEVIAESEAEVERLLERIERAITEGKSLGETLEEENARLAVDRAAIDDEAKSVREEEAKIKGRRKELDALKNALGVAQVRVREYQLGRDALRQQIDERYRVSIDEILPDFHLLPPQSEKEVDRIEALRSQIESIGPINLTAIDEYNEVNERYTFLEAQKQDLEQAIATLQTAIKRINRTSKDRYIEAFKLVNEKFQLVFPRLFNGGTASLVMLDESDPLESGIEMLAQPPGKKLQSVSLLSGGEKALTAVALIFSIFLIKPTPFCLLDEVDAPLDEANVSRYNELVKDMSSLSQFILITHNKRTMELPDRLYGVTMEEPGISKIVPVDLIGEKRSRLKAV